MRAFIAIELDDESREILCNIQEQLKKQGIKGNFSRPENLHLTIRFLGEIDWVTSKKVNDIMKNVASKYNSFVLTLDSLGKFVKGNKMIIWAGLRQNEQLLCIYRDLEAKLECVIPNLEKMNYKPHITLVREAVPPEKVLKIISASEAVEHVFPATGISLMESTRIDGRLTYIRRAFEPLQLP